MKRIAETHLVIDLESRLRARRIIKKITSEGLHPDDVEVDWPHSKDMAVRSIRFWLWTLFDDDSDQRVGLDCSNQRRVLANSEEFLGTSLRFQLRAVGLFDRLNHIQKAGFEWRGCELPWHSRWPFPAK